MPDVKIVLDPETYAALAAEAKRYVRPTDWHALAVLRQALGLEFPYPPFIEKPASANNTEGRGTSTKLVRDGGE